MRGALRGRDGDYLNKTHWLLPNKWPKLEQKTLFPNFCPKTQFLPFSPREFLFKWGRVLLCCYIYRQVSRSIMRCDTFHSYLPYVPFQNLTSFNLEFLTTFSHLFRGKFQRSYGVQNRSCLILFESLRCLLSNYIKFSQIGARTGKLWLPEVRVSKQFFSIFLARVLAKLKMLPANRELLVVTELIFFLKVLDLRINLQRVGKTLCPKVVSWVENVSDFQHNFLTFVDFPLYG